MINGFVRGRGLLRSVLIYHALPYRQRRLRRFYASFVRPDDLCFDIGAHVGSRVRAWSALGARIVAVEPQPQCMRLLRRWFGHQAQVRLVEQALGAAPGTAELYISRRTPTVSTVSASWIERVSAERSFRGVRWDETLAIDVLTLDQLIAEYGVPAFCKIDVEGYEAEVLHGLSQPLKALSFEYLPAAVDTALSCIDRIRKLGRYEFNWSPGESHRLATESWLDAGEMTARLPLIATAGSGDIYARLTTRTTG